MRQEGRRKTILYYELLKMVCLAEELQVNESQGVRVGFSWSDCSVWTSPPSQYGKGPDTV
jgi:hypothetical protein